jgi:preprotein translocase subunit SecY
MLSAFSNSFKIPELRQRILFTLGLVFVCRLIAAVPIPGVDVASLRAYMAQAGSMAGAGFLGLFNLFSGGAFENCAVGALGIMPYISASIILQLMTAVVPALERLAREGDSGRQKIIQYTRYLTVFLCLIQGYFFALSLETPGALFEYSFVGSPGLAFRLLAVVALTAGTLLLMWVGEQITERGIGNGTSLVITIGIVASIPGAIQQTVTMFKPVDGWRSTPSSTRSAWCSCSSWSWPRSSPSPRLSARFRCSTPSAWWAIRCTAARAPTCPCGSTTRASCRSSSVPPS